MIQPLPACGGVPSVVGNLANPYQCPDDANKQSSHDARFQMSPVPFELYCGVVVWTAVGFVRGDDHVGENSEYAGAPDHGPNTMKEESHISFSGESSNRNASDTAPRIKACPAVIESAARTT